MLDHMVILFLIFRGTSILFSLVGAPTYVPTKGAGGFPTPPAFVICRLLKEGHSDQHEVIPHCSFDFHFSNEISDAEQVVCILLAEGRS